MSHSNHGSCKPTTVPPALKCPTLCLQTSSICGGSCTPTPNTPNTPQEEELWIYNCRDCCATLEAYHNLKRELTTANLWPQYQFQKQQLNELALPMMLRGFKIDTKSRSSMQLELLDACLLYTSPSPRDRTRSRMPSSA